MDLNERFCIVPILQGVSTLYRASRGHDPDYRKLPRRPVRLRRLRADRNRLCQGLQGTLHSFWSAPCASPHRAFVKHLA